MGVIIQFLVQCHIFADVPTPIKTEPLSLYDIEHLSGRCVNYYDLLQGKTEILCGNRQCGFSALQILQHGCALRSRGIVAGISEF